MQDQEGGGRDDHDFRDAFPSLNAVGRTQEALEG